MNVRSFDLKSCKLSTFRLSYLLKNQTYSQTDFTLTNFTGFSSMFHFMGESNISINQF